MPSAATSSTPSTGRLIAAKQAARELGVPYCTLRDACFKGLLPVVKFGRAWYFDRADLARFIEAQKERLA